VEYLTCKSVSGEEPICPVPAIHEGRFWLAEEGPISHHRLRMVREPAARFFVQVGKLGKRQDEAVHRLFELAGILRERGISASTLD